MSPQQNSKRYLGQKVVALLALTSQSLALASPLTDPAVHAAKGKEAGTLDATGEAKTRVRLVVADRETGARTRGYNQGFHVRAEQLIAAEFERGRAQGDPEGAVAGRADGRQRGEIDGVNAGIQQGESEGYAAADRDARVAGTQRGSAQGRAEADRTDAAAQGAAAGKIKGDQDAKAAAQQNEYGPAREQYASERYAERVDSQSTIDLKKGLVPFAEKAEATVARYSTSAMSLADLAVLNFVTDPTVPNVKPTQGAEKALAYCKDATASAPAEHQACVEVFVKAYNEAFTATFPSQYLANYREQWPVEFNAGVREGTAAADRDSGVSRRRHDAYAQGRKRGFDEGYRLAYDRAYRPTYDVFHEQARRDSAARKYQEVYASLEANYFEQARRSAFEARKVELYNAAFETARKAEYNARYAGYAAQVRAQARADEARDFELKPVRLTTKLQVMESIDDGILEPAENLSLTFQLRNFAAHAVEAKDLDFRAVAVDSAGVAIPETMAILTKSLAPKSLTTIRGAFTIQLNDAALASAKRVQVTLSYKGRVFAQDSIGLKANTLTKLELAAAPETRLGYPGVLKLQVTNQSRKALPEESLLVLDTRVEGITFEKIQAPVGLLAPGASAVVEFPFMNHSYGLSKPVAFLATLTSKSGRLTGVLSQSQQLPVLKDFEVKVVKGDLDKLTRKGRESVRIRVYNVSDVPSASSVTVEASIVPSSGSYQFIKGSKVVYRKISPGNYGEQKVTVKANQKGGHGKFVMKVTVGDKFLGYFEETF